MVETANYILRGYCMQSKSLRLHCGDFLSHTCHSLEEFNVGVCMCVQACLVSFFNFVNNSVYTYMRLFINYIVMKSKISVSIKPASVRHTVTNNLQSPLPGCTDWQRRRQLVRWEMFHIKNQMWKCPLVYCSGIHVVTTNRPLGLPQLVEEYCV